MPTVAQIAKKSFDAASKAIPDAIHDCVGFHMAEDRIYDPEAGGYLDAGSPWSGRALVNTGSAIKDMYPAYVAGPADILIYIEGASQAPMENDIITIKGVERKIVHTGDIVGAGTFFAVVAR